MVTNEVIELSSYSGWELFLLQDSYCRSYKTHFKLLLRRKIMYKKVSTDLKFVDREKETEKFWEENHNRIMKQQI